MHNHSDLLDTLVCLLYAVICLAGTAWFFWDLRTAWWPVFQA